MTMDVYAQLEQRAQRCHGTAFDRILRTAREQLEDLAEPSTTLKHWATIGPRSENQPDLAAPEPPPEDEKLSNYRDFPMARPRLELGTPRFSVVCSTN